MMNRTMLAICGCAAALAPVAASAQEAPARQPRSLDFSGRVITVSSPLVLDAREIDRVATPLRFDPTHFEAIDSAQRVYIADFPLDRTTRIDLELENFSVLAPGAVLVKGNQTGGTPIDAAPIATLRGSVAGIPGSKVFLAISPLMSNGFIEIDGTTHIISNGSFERQTGITVYNLTDLPEGTISWFEHACTLVDIPDSETLVSRGDPAEPEFPCRIADVAIEADNELSEIFSRDPEVAQPATMNYIETLVGAVSEIYTEQFGMRLRIAYTRIWPDQNEPDIWNSQTTSEALSEMNALWTELDAPFAGTWHSAHLFSGRPLGGGIAFLGAVCSLDFAQAVSANLNGFFPTPVEPNLPQNWDLYVTAHEWGHNFGAPHTHGVIPPIDQCGFGNCAQAPSGTIMSYCHLCPGGLENINLVFSPRMLSDHILPFVTLQMPCDLIVLDENECAGLSNDCPADVNQDGQLTPADFTAWIIAFNNNDLRADLNGNGTLEPADFSAWIASWVAGCDN